MDILPPFSLKISFSSQMPMTPWDTGVGCWKHFGAWWWCTMVGLAVAGRAGWALVFTRLPVAAWAPTSPHQPASAPSPRPSAKIIS